MSFAGAAAPHINLSDKAYKGVTLIIVLRQIYFYVSTFNDD